MADEQPRVLPSYKVSKYNILVPVPEHGLFCIHNTLTGARILAAEDDNDLKGVLAGHFEGVCAELLNDLFESGLIVDSDRNEYSDVRDINQAARHDRNRLDLHIMPNMNCNFACSYCYEDHRKSDLSIPKQDSILKWLRNELSETSVLLVSWFGGEPLLSFTALARMQGKIRDLCAERGVELVSHITTNGYALDAEKAASLIDLGLFSYQITVDGGRESHNTTRPLRGGQGTFDTILANIHTLCRLSNSVSLKLRVNYQLDTLSSIPELLAKIEPDIRGNVDLVLEPIFGESFGDNAEDQALSIPAVAQSYDLAKQMGFNISKAQLPSVKGTYCYADRERQYVIDHDANVFKCTVSRFDEKARLGRIEEDGVLTLEGDRWERWMREPGQDEKCSQCQYAPLCMGGCRKVRIALGTMGESCTLPFAGLRDSIRNEVLEQLRGQEDVAHSGCCQATDG